MDEGLIVIRYCDSSSFFFLQEGGVPWGGLV